MELFLLHGKQHHSIAIAVYLGKWHTGVKLNLQSCYVFFLNYYQAFLPLIMERAKALVKERLWSLDLAVAASLVYLLCASTLAS